MQWAKLESEKAEAERKKRLAEQEKADFEFALALSKAESWGYLNIHSYVAVRTI